MATLLHASEYLSKADRTLEGAAYASADNREAAARVAAVYVELAWAVVELRGK